VLLQWVEVEIAIAAAAPAPTAHIVSKIWAVADASLTLKRLTTQALDFDFPCFSLMIASLICSPVNRKTISRAVRASAAVGFEPTPTPEDDWLIQYRLDRR